MSDDSLDFSFLYNYLSKIPINFSESYLESRSITGFSANFLDEIQELLKHIEFLENVLQEFRTLISTQSKSNKRKSKIIESLKIEIEELQDVVKSYEILNKDLKKMLERENDAKNDLLEKLIEKENENNDFIQIIENLNSKIINYEQASQLQASQIHQLEQSVAESQNKTNNLTSQSQLYTPMIRKINRDYDSIIQEKTELENILKKKNEDYLALEKKYLKVLRKNESLVKDNQKYEIEELETRQEIEILKSKITTLRNSLRFSRNYDQERSSITLKRPPFSQRKTKSLINYKEEPRFKSDVFEARTTHFEIKRTSTLFEEIPQYNSPILSSLMLDLAKVNEFCSFPSNNNVNSNSSQGHIHQESFGLQNKEKSDNVVENIDIESCHNNGGESPKFAKANERVSNLSARTTSTIEVDFMNLNPYPFSKSSNDDNISVVSKSFNDGESKIEKLMNSKLNNSEKTMKKLIEIEKRNRNSVNKKPNDGERELKNLEKENKQMKSFSKMHNFMKITLSLFPSGMFFNKIIDLSEEIMIEKKKK